MKNIKRKSYKYKEDYVNAVAKEKINQVKEKIAEGTVTEEVANKKIAKLEKRYNRKAEAAYRSDIRKIERDVFVNEPIKEAIEDIAYVPVAGALLAKYIINDKG